MRFSNVFLLDLPKCLWSVSQCLTTRVFGPWYWSRSITELQLFPPDGQSKQAWASEMLCLSTSHELSEIISHHTEHLMQTLAVLLFTAQWNCQQMYITVLWDTSMRSIFYQPMWMNVVLCIFNTCQSNWKKIFMCSIICLQIWMDMGKLCTKTAHNQWKKHEEQDKKPVDISNGSI